MVRKLGEKKKPGRPPALIARKRPPGEACARCGHWSTATEYGVDEKSGYCDRWEKLTTRDFWCEEFVSQENFKKMQDQLAEESEDFLDEET